jgi:hypothetical protein
MVGQYIWLWDIPLDTYNLCVACSVVMGGLLYKYHRVSSIPLPYLLVYGYAVVMVSQLGANLFACLEQSNLTWGGVLQGQYGSNFIGGLLVCVFHGKAALARFW